MEFQAEFYVGFQVVKDISLEFFLVQRSTGPRHLGALLSGRSDVM
jgi:hypothetical protein